MQAISSKPKYRLTDLTKAISDRTTEIRTKNYDRSEPTIQQYISEDPELMFLQKELANLNSSQTNPSKHPPPPSFYNASGADSQAPQSLAHIDNPRPPPKLQDVRNVDASSKADKGKGVARHDPDGRNSAPRDGRRALPPRPQRPRNTTAPSSPSNDLSQVSMRVAHHKDYSESPRAASSRQIAASRDPPSAPKPSLKDEFKALIARPKHTSRKANPRRLSALPSEAAPSSHRPTQPAHHAVSATHDHQSEYYEEDYDEDYDEEDDEDDYEEVEDYEEADEQYTTSAATSTPTSITNEQHIYQEQNNITNSAQVIIQKKIVMVGVPLPPYPYPYLYDPYYYPSYQYGRWRRRY